MIQLLNSRALILAWIYRFCVYHTTTVTGLVRFLFKTNRDKNNLIVKWIIHSNNILQRGRRMFFFSDNLIGYTFYNIMIDWSSIGYRTFYKLFSYPTPKSIYCSVSRLTGAHFLCMMHAGHDRPHPAWSLLFSSVKL